jgi:hypothetical protein
MAVGDPAQRAPTTIASYAFMIDLPEYRPERPVREVEVADYRMAAAQCTVPSTPILSVVGPI